MASDPEIVDLLSSDDDDDKRATCTAVKPKSEDIQPAGRKFPAKRLRPTGSVLAIDSSSDDDILLEGYKSRAAFTASKKPVAKKRAASTGRGLQKVMSDASSSSSRNRTAKPRARSTTFTTGSKNKSRNLQAGLVLEEDVVAALTFHQRIQNASGEEGEDAPCAARFLRKQHERIANKEEPLLFEDEEFAPVAASIDGIHKKSAFGNRGSVKNDDTDESDPMELYPKCWCKRPAKLCFKVQSAPGKAYFTCAGGMTVNKTTTASGGTIAMPAKPQKCSYFSWAFRSELMPWYRFGQHNQHTLVRGVYNGMSSNYSPVSFSAQDLVQGKVGDCWFLSALAVVAERPDLIQRLFQRETSDHSSISAIVANWEQEDQWGMVQVNLFLDGFWTRVTMDNFLPCIVGQINKQEEADLKRAIEESLKPAGSQTNKDPRVRNPYAKKPTGEGRRLMDGKVIAASSNSDHDPSVLSQSNLQIMLETQAFLDRQRRKTAVVVNNNSSESGLEVLDGPAESQDLAYSKARRNQLWVPILEKAYAKVHGSYKAISGGHIAEAFLDLTGAPTLQIQWHRNGAHQNSSIYDPKPLWSKLLQWKAQRLPMGCGTDSSAQGIIGMHAYSILDVREIANVGVEFFQEQLLTGTLGNVSGFTEYDGKVRLLRIRNPHGQGEWKGDFSDKSSKWEELLRTGGASLPRTMTNDGTFWIDYDNFLLGYSNIDVVLAFQGNHAKSFATNFPSKKSNHRCIRAFEVSLIDPQPGMECKDHVEVYVMGIQKSRRGAKQGRADRKKSYKVSDMGMLVGEYPLHAKEDEEENFDLSTVHGQMFGFRRNGHYRLVLDRSKCRRMVVMPISFGHPAATDKEFSFAVRFNADAPLMIRELENVPLMNRVLSRFALHTKPHGNFEETRQGEKKVLWQNTNFKVVQVDCLGNGGGTVFVYLCSKTPILGKKVEPLSLTLEASVRGMSCRTEEGLLEHETISKGKKFEASWRRYKKTFTREQKGRLLMVLYQSGQDTEMGGILCSVGNTVSSSIHKNEEKSKAATTLDHFWSATVKSKHDDQQYQQRGIFTPLDSMDAETFDRCGHTYESLNKYAAFVASSVTVDEDLEAAIDLSRQQFEQLQNDNDLEVALRRSRSREEVGEGSASKNQDVTVIDLAHDDADLKRALELSIATASSNRKVVETADLTDLTHPNAAFANSVKNEPVASSSPDIIMLDDDSSEEGEDKNEKETEKRPAKLPGPPEKKAKTKSPPKSDNREMKRKLAAEAAMKRWEG